MSDIKLCGNCAAYATAVGNAAIGVNDLDRDLALKRS
jgi:hypothetical protein